MTNRQENGDISQLKTDVAVIQTDLGYIKKDLKTVVDFVEVNKGGIRTASILDNKIITVVIGGVVAAGIYFIGKGGL